MATVAVGEMGARNAGHLAAEILALSDPEVALRVRAKRERMAGRVQPEGFDRHRAGDEIRGLLGRVLPAEVLPPEDPAETEPGDVQLLERLVGGRDAAVD